MDTLKFVASCPICGRILFKGTPSSCLEGGCPKCGELLKIVFTEEGFQVSTAGSHTASKRSVPSAPSSSAL